MLQEQSVQGRRRAMCKAYRPSDDHLAMSTLEALNNFQARQNKIPDAFDTPRLIIIVEDRIRDPLNDIHVLCQILTKVQSMSLHVQTFLTFYNCYIVSESHDQCQQLRSDSQI